MSEFMVTRQVRSMDDITQILGWLEIPERLEVGHWARFEVDGRQVKLRVMEVMQDGEPWIIALNSSGVPLHELKLVRGFIPL